MRILKSAFKHGITEEQIIYVLEYAIFEKLLRLDPPKWLYTGVTNEGVALEIITVINDDGSEVVIHAMKLRKKYSTMMKEGH